MHSKSLVLFLLFTCASLVLVAQKNYLPGFVVHKNGDTVHGMIDYRNWERNPRKITFKTDAEVSYTVNELRYFSIPGNDSYVRAVVQKDMLPVHLSLLENEGYAHTIKDTVFLRILVDGSKLSLYELLDQKYHYYIKRPAGGYEELIYKILRRDDAAQEYTVYNTFRDQLQFGVTDETIRKRIAKASYKEEDLKKIGAALNEDSTGIASKSKTKARTIAFLQAVALPIIRWGFQISEI